MNGFHDIKNWKSWENVGVRYRQIVRWTDEHFLDSLTSLFSPSEACPFSRLLCSALRYQLTAHFTQDEWLAPAVKLSLISKNEKCGENAKIQNSNRFEKVEGSNSNLSSLRPPTTLNLLLLQTSYHFALWTFHSFNPLNSHCLKPSITSKLPLWTSNRFKPPTASNLLPFQISHGFDVPPLWTSYRFKPLLI